MITCIQYKTSHRHTFGESIRQKNSAGIINMHGAQTLETNILYKHKKDEQNSTNITETYSTNIRHAYSTTIRDIHMVQASQRHIWYKHHSDIHMVQASVTLHMAQALHRRTYDTSTTEISTLVCVKTMVNTEWDRLLLSFIPVAAVARFLLPRVIHPFKGTRMHR